METKPSYYEEVIDEPKFVEPEEVEEEPISEDTFAVVHQGHLRDSFKIGQHDFSIRSLYVGEELEAHLLASKYKDTIDYGRAIQAAFVAACITSKDGKPLVPNPIGPEDEKLEVKFHLVLSSFYSPTILAVYKRYSELYGKLEEIYGDVKKD